MQQSVQLVTVRAAVSTPLAGIPGPKTEQVIEAQIWVQRAVRTSHPLLVLLLHLQLSCEVNSVCLSNVHRIA